MICLVIACDFIYHNLKGVLHRDAEGNSHVIPIGKPSDVTMYKSDLVSHNSIIHNHRYNLMMKYHVHCNFKCFVDRCFRWHS